MSRFCLLAGLLLTGWRSAAAQVELRLEYPALERMLASQVFTQDGRKYVKGRDASGCNFAYLENPKVSAEQGRLRIRSRFGGRSGLRVMVKCVGLGDTFDVTIYASPHYKDGHVVFNDVMVDSYGKDTVYRRAVRLRMARTLQRDFRYPLAEEATRILEQTRASEDYVQKISHFNVDSIAVMPDALVLALRFRLTVK